MKTLLSFFIVAGLTVLITGCSSQISSAEGQACSGELSTAETEFDKAKADGLGEMVSMTKAASLITAAAFEKQIEKYEGCTDKARRARAYIADARKH